jgi:hypothetical protein
MAQFDSVKFYYNQSVQVVGTIFLVFFYCAAATKLGASSSIFIFTNVKITSRGRVRVYNLEGAKLKKKKNWRAKIIKIKKFRGKFLIFFLEKFMGLGARPPWTMAGFAPDHKLSSTSPPPYVG